MLKLLLARLPPIAAYGVWLSLRALAWIALLSCLLSLATRNRKLVAAYWGAHLAALALGCGGDVLLWKVITGAAGSISQRETLFVAPIFIFTAISLWIAGWEKTVGLPDVLMAILPLALYAGLVIKGWQTKEFGDVFGAWFVSAASGAVDLTAVYGPPWARRRGTALRLAGYAAAALLVYAVMPWTE